jgi:HTH-type transcriptional regulator, sugar sensing transcriptional regulator
MIEELKQVGLGNYESKALEVLMKEKLSLRNLSKKAQIPFGKVYSVVKNLKGKGFVKETNSRPKLIYVENASEIISRLIKEKQEKDRSVLEKLRAASIEIDKNKGKESKFFEIGTTIEENKKIQLRSFRESENEVLQIINIHHKPASNRESKTLWEKEIEKAVNRGVIFKAIYPKGTELPMILKRLNKEQPEKFQVKRFDSDFTRCDIIDGKKVLLKLVQEDPLQFGGVLFLENEKLAENLTKIFNEMWDKIE